MPFTIKVDATIAGLQELARRVDSATQRIVISSSEMFRAKASIYAPMGQLGNTTNPPGDLARSINVEGPTGSGGQWSSLVGPTVTTINPGIGGKVFNYGRLREFGGEITPNVRPFLVFRKFGMVFKKESVYQEGSHFLLRSRIEGSENVEALMAYELTLAVRGY